MNSSEKQTGRICFYNFGRAFGFVLGDNGQKYYLHISKIMRKSDGMKATPMLGSVVKFHAGAVTKEGGYPEALNVEVSSVVDLAMIAGMAVLAGEGAK